LYVVCDFLQAEGLVHVSNISSARLGSAKEAVERGQEVWVKVVSVSGGKLGLSIRDVDQATGRDLLDLEKIRAAQGTAGAAGGQQQSALMGISGIKVNPKDFEETTKR
jgi:ATP-dependent RNA helicase DHX8/PRP22